MLGHNGRQLEKLMCRSGAWVWGVGVAGEGEEGDEREKGKRIYGYNEFMYVTLPFYFCL